MPIYEYKCGRCSYQFELRRGFGEDNGIAPCPVCQGKSLRIFSPVPIIFKGSGFYITDSRAKSHTLESDHSSKEDSKETKADSGSTKAEDKSTAKASAKDESK